MKCTLITTNENKRRYWEERRLSPAAAMGWIDWNLLLDTQGGPNHVHNFCDAPIMAAEDFDDVVKHLSYYYIGHCSRRLP